MTLDTTLVNPQTDPRGFRVSYGRDSARAGEALDYCAPCLHALGIRRPLAGDEIIDHATGATVTVLTRMNLGLWATACDRCCREIGANAEAAGA